MMSNESDTPLSKQDPVETWNGLKSRLSSTGRSSRYEISEADHATKIPSKGSYNANDTALNRPVFLKKLDADEQEDHDQLERFLKEARLTGQLQHPNIIPVHDLLKAPDGSMLFTLRYVEGLTLREMVETVNDGAGLEDMLGKVLNVCDAIAFAHQKNISHNALGLDTIILGPFGEVFVLNWENATEAENDPSAYKPDILAVGQILQTIVHTICNVQQRAVPLSLAAVIRRVSGVGKRAYTSMDELGADIRRYLAGEPTLAEEASPIRQFTLLLLRRKLEAGAFAAFFILAAGLTVWFMDNIQRQRDRKVKAAEVAKEAQLTAEEKFWEEQASVKQLEELVPYLKKQITEYIATGRPTAALNHAELSLELAPENAELWENKGDVLQVLFRFDESVTAYNSALKWGGDPDRLKNKLQVSDRFIRMLHANSGRLTDNIVMTLCQELKRTGRQFEANLFLADFQGRQQVAVDEITRNLKKDEKRYVLDPETGLEFEYDLGAGDCKVTLIDSLSRHTSLTPVLSIPFARLDCQACPELQTLKGLETHPLIELKTGPCKIDDLSPLKSLPLEHLEMETPNVSSLQPLQGVPLRTLKIINSGVSDLAPLAGLPLTELDLGGSTDVTTLVPLKSLSLEKLGLAETAISTLDPVPSQDITHLNIAGTKVNDLSSLEGGKLEELNISRTPCRSIRPLLSHPLRTLLMNDSGVVSFEGIQESPVIEIRADGCPITSLDPLGMCSTLRHLNVSRTDVGEIPRNSWSNLRLLNLDHTNVKDLTPLKGCPIRDLSLRHTEVTDITPVVNRMLYKLDLAYSKVSDLTPLANSNVKILNLAHTPVADISQLKDVYLSKLDLSHTNITSLNGLEQLPLASLNIINTKVSDLSPLKSIPLKVIYLSSDNIKDGCDVLATMPGLQEIHFENRTYSRKTFPHFSKGAKGP